MWFDRPAQPPSLSLSLPTGIGYASIVIVSLLNIYYIVILAWGVYYLFKVGSCLLLFFFFIVL